MDWMEQLKKIKDQMSGGGNTDVALDKGTNPAANYGERTQFLNPQEDTKVQEGITSGYVPRPPTPPAPIVPPPAPVAVAPMPMAAPVPKAEPMDAETKVLSALAQSTDIDDERRKRFQTALDAKKQGGIAGVLGGGIADSFMAANRARFGTNSPEGTFAKQAEDKMDKTTKEDTTKFEEGLKTDPTSGISKQYQESAKLFLEGKAPQIWQNKSAAQIAATLPMVEKYMANKMANETRKEIAEQNSLAKAAAAKEKTDAKTAAAKEKKDLAVSDAVQQASIIRQAIGDIKKKGLIGYDTVGPTGSRALAPFDKPSLEAKLNTIRANIAFDKLMKIRQSSPTGGAVGNVSDKDIALLQAVLGSLDTEQDPKQLQESLERLDEIYKKVQGYAQPAPEAASATAGGATTHAVAPADVPQDKITVSNGTKTFRISPDKLADAEKDGFKRI